MSLTETTTSPGSVSFASTTRVAFSSAVVANLLGSAAETLPIRKIPALAEVILEVDLQEGKMVIEPPEGLIDDL